MSVIFHILGMVAGGALIVWRARRAGVRLNGVRFFVGCLFLIAFGIVGARLAYVAADLNYYIVHWQQIFSIYGTIIQGAIIFGLLGLIPLAWFLRIPYWKLADLFAPGVALGQAIGRIGCMVQGCCYGVPIQLPGLEGTGWIYPTQAMHGCADLLIALLLLHLDKRGYKPFDGFLFLLYTLLFSTERLLIDFLRDPATSPVFAAGMLFEGMHEARVISVASIMLALIVLAWRWLSARRRARENAA
jgi:phosphatidylglycerol:prolipoprotein diacylglycerol transferase